MLLAALVCGALLGGADSRITEAKVSKDDRPIILVAEPFGFGPDGRIDIEIANETFYTTPGAPKLDASKMGIFITTAEAEPQLEIDLDTQGTCILDNKHVSTLFTFQ
eukprot:scaffold266581_cov44-Prasinocladus_malaysianus.AAC.1